MTSRGRTKVHVFTPPPHSALCFAVGIAACLDILQCDLYYAYVIMSQCVMLGDGGAPAHDCMGDRVSECNWGRYIPQAEVLGLNSISCGFGLAG